MTYDFDLTGLPSSLALSVALAHAEASISAVLERDRRQFVEAGMSDADAAALVAWEREQLQDRLQEMERELVEWLAEGDAARLN